MRMEKTKICVGGALMAIAVLTCFGVAQAAIVPASPSPFTAVDRKADFQPPEIVLQYDPVAKTGYDWAKIGDYNYYQLLGPEAPVVNAVRYLREAIKRMTGQELPVVSRNDLTRGIVITTLKAAPAELRNDPEVIRALRNNGQDSYNANEAFFIRTEPQRIVIVTNGIEGFGNAVMELVESVGYEALGMGPDWTYIPDYTDKPLVFALRRAGRPGFYLRQFGAASGQPGGIGTLFLTPLPDPADETVEISYGRWLTGARMATQSMPPFPGHAMQAYHRAVVEAMRKSGGTAGFLNTVSVGLEATRPATAKENSGALWINNDAAGTPEAGKVYYSDGAAWQAANPTYVPAALDLSVPMVREIILADMKAQAKTHFEKNPDELFVFGTDSEDGTGHAELGKYLHDKNWYPDYLKKAGVKFGQPYVLNGFKGLNQPKEIWDFNAPSDTVFGFNNWLLREYDKWIDSLPAEDRKTATGKSKKDLTRASLYSYNYHDVPANFNLDARIRVMIAGYPKHRGQGKWKNFATQLDMAQAFQKQLPREPSGDYWILSLAAYHDFNTYEITNNSKLPTTLQKEIAESYRAGFRAVSAEVDFNHGRLGLDYYMYSKLLWNPHLSAAQLDDIRTRWIQRAFGDGWREMKQYYDFLAPENATVNAPNNWAKAIRFIEAADQKIADNSAAQKRLDDLKQFWYFYYLVESGQATADSSALKEFLWKGQMSYMTAMHMVASHFFKATDVREVVGLDVASGPAHYTHAETQAWWAKTLDFWQVTPVAEFAEATLNNGVKGAAVDQNDLVAVREFQSEANAEGYFYYPSDWYDGGFLTVAMRAGQEIGFKLSWPHNLAESRYSPKDVAYGIARYNPDSKKWEELVDIANTKKTSVLVKGVGEGAADSEMVEVRYKAPSAGAYRVSIGKGGNLAKLASLDYDTATDTFKGTRPFAYSALGDGYTQSPAYIYIPKGTKSLDLEVWNPTNNKKLQLNTGLPATGLTPTRVMDVSKQGTHKVALNPGEDGSIAYFSGDVFNFPSLYSVPILWAKSPAALLVPRAVAEADGLTIVR